MELRSPGDEESLGGALENRNYKEVLHAGTCVGSKEAKVHQEVLQFRAPGRAPQRLLSCCQLRGCWFYCHLHWAAEQPLWAAEILLLQLKEKKRGPQYLDANMAKI